MLPPEGVELVTKAVKLTVNEGQVLVMGELLTVGAEGNALTVIVVVIEQPLLLV